MSGLLILEEERIHCLAFSGCARQGSASLLDPTSPQTQGFSSPQHSVEILISFSLNRQFSLAIFENDFRNRFKAPASHFPASLSA